MRRLRAVECLVLELRFPKRRRAIALAEVARTAGLSLRRVRAIEREAFRQLRLEAGAAPRRRPAPCWKGVRRSCGACLAGQMG